MMPEWPLGEPEQGGAGLSDQITDFLQDRFNQVPSDLGPQVVGDWILVAEVATGGGRRFLRIVDSDLPPWRTLGLVEFLRQNAQTDSITCNMLEDDDEGGEDA